MVMLIDDLRFRLSTFSERENADPEVYPAMDIAELFSIGMMSAPFPKYLGGGGLSCEECVSLIIELAAAAPSTALIACMPMGLAAGATAATTAAPPDHRAKAQDLLERVVADFSKQRLYAACNSERSAGGALSVMNTVARRDASGQFRITGEKILASGGKHAATFFSGASVGQTDLPGAAAVEFFLIDASSPGVHVQSDWNGLGMRSSESHTVLYEDAPAREILGYPMLLEIAQPWAFSFCLFTAIPLGCARGILQEMSTPVPTSPAVRLRLVEAQMRYEAARAYLLETARGWEPGSSEAWRSRVVRTKSYVAQEMTRLCGELFALSGGRHYRRSSRVARLMEASYAGTALRPPLPLALDVMVAGLAPLGPTDI